MRTALPTFLTRRCSSLPAPPEAPALRGRLARVAVGLVAALAVGFGAAGCSTAAPATSAPSPSPASATASPIASATPGEPTAASTASPLPSPTLDGLRFPADTDLPVPPGRYVSAPPFEVPFTFDVAGEGWRTWHLIEEFVDIARYDAAVSSTLPVRWLAFNHPLSFIGPPETPASSLDVEGAIALLRSRSDLTVGPAQPFVLDGLEGLRVDLHALAANTQVTRGGHGRLGMQPERDARMGVVPLDGGLLVVFLFAPPGELDAGWTEVAPILASVDL